MPSSAPRPTDQLVEPRRLGTAPPRLEADLPWAADVGHLGEDGEVAAGAVAADGLAKDHPQRAVGRKLQRHRGAAVALDERGGVAMPSGNRIPQLGLLPRNAERDLAGERPRLLVAEEVNLGVVGAAMNPVGNSLDVGRDVQRRQRLPRRSRATLPPSQSSSAMRFNSTASCRPVVCSGFGPTTTAPARTRSRTFRAASSDIDFRFGSTSRR